MKFLSEENKGSKDFKTKLFIWSIGFFSGLASAINSEASSGRDPDLRTLILKIFIFSFLGGVVFLFIWKILISLSKKIATNEKNLKRFKENSRWPFILFLSSFLGAWGIQFNILTTGVIWILFILGQLVVLNVSTKGLAFKTIRSSKSIIAGLFMLSGIAALVYQVVWQRLLFTLFGVNIESVTLIVSIFMFGLGVGAFAGGWLSERFSKKLPELFLWIEIGIAIFGFVSIPLIELVGHIASEMNTTGIGLAVYLVLFFPTLCMGATLPILVAYLHKENTRLGASVGLLYTFNTIGSALACFLTAGILFRFLGLTGSVWFAASCNLLTGALVFIYCKSKGFKLI